jgi:hypothetical protein
MRIPRPRRRLLILAAVAAGLLVATVAVMCVGLPYLRHREVRGCLAAFNADPTQENATRLAEIIASGRADKEEITEILRAWLDLKVITEKSYQPNTPIYVTIVSGNKTRLACGPWPKDEDEPQPTRDSPQVWIDLHYCLAFSTHADVPALFGPNSDSVVLGPDQARKLVDKMDVLSSPQPSHAPLSIAEPGVYQAFVALEATPHISHSFNVESETGVTRYGSFYPLRETDRGILDTILIRLGLKGDYGPMPIRFKVEVPCEIRIVPPPEPPADKSP